MWKTKSSCCNCISNKHYTCINSVVTVEYSRSAQLGMYITAMTKISFGDTVIHVHTRTKLRLFVLSEHYPGLFQQKKIAVNVHFMCFLVIFLLWHHHFLVMTMVIISTDMAKAINRIIFFLLKAYTWKRQSCDNKYCLLTVYIFNTMEFFTFVIAVMTTDDKLFTKNALNI